MILFILQGEKPLGTNQGGPADEVFSDGSGVQILVSLVQCFFPYGGRRGEGYLLLFF